MIIDPIRVCELLVGLGEVTVLGADDEPDGPVRVHVETRTARPPCPGCGLAVWAKDQRPVELVDLPSFGRPARLVWHKRRWSCPTRLCAVGSFTETAPDIASARLVMTDRAGRWVTEQVGRWHRSVNELAVELGCDWHTINDTVLAYGTPLVEDPDRIGDVDAIGLDETLFARLGRWRTQHWSTSIVDVRRGQLLDVIPGRSSVGACRWFAEQDQAWLDRIAWATLDLAPDLPAGTDARLATLITRMLHKAPADRPQDSRDVVERLGRVAAPLTRTQQGLATMAQNRATEAAEQEAKQAAEQELSRRWRALRTQAKRDLDEIVADAIEIVMPVLTDVEPVEEPECGLSSAEATAYLDVGYHPFGELDDGGLIAMAGAIEIGPGGREGRRARDGMLRARANDWERVANVGYQQIQGRMEWVAWRFNSIGSIRPADYNFGPTDRPHGLDGKAWKSELENGFGPFLTATHVYRVDRMLLTGELIADLIAETAR